MTFEIRPFSSKEATLFYSSDEKDKELSCIGHLRGDFGYKGKEFWHTWFDHQAELNTPEFKADIAAVINELRTRGPLKDLESMASYCYGHREARIPDAWHSDTYGFYVNTERYRYFIRCFPQQGDYNFYVYCYENEKEPLNEKTKGRQIQTVPKKKTRVPER